MSKTFQGDEEKNSGVRRDETGNIKLSADNRCLVCDGDFYFRWSDTHGVGVCGHCGMPYTILHYDADSKRIGGLPPSAAIKPEWIPVARAYHQETKGRVFPASYDMGFLRGSRSYSGATPYDLQQWDTWLESHPELLPATQVTREQKG